MSHLPADKQRDILEILEIIKEIALPEKVILFGSFARGDWVDDEYVEDGIIYSYRSDFDFLVVTQGSKLKEFDIRNRIENRTRSYKHPVNPLVHELEHINYGLERGQYFFKSIVEGGILLYETKLSAFAKPRPLSKVEQREQALLYYENWVESGVRMFRIAELALKASYEENFVLNEVLFLLHQTVEKLYAGLGLVYYGYKPKTHNIKEYKNYTKGISPEIDNMFINQNSSSEEKRLFEILQKSYIDARYKSNYYVSRADVEDIMDQVKKLKGLILNYCLNHISGVN